jgi:hypothetical protein
MTSTAAPNLAGLWLGVSELPAAVQGTWQAAAVAGAGHGGQLLRATTQSIDTQCQCVRESKKTESNHPRKIKSENSAKF